MLSILLGHSYFLRFDRKQFERAKPYPPLATLQVAGLLRAAGHEVTLFDAMLAEGTAEYRDRLARARPRVAVFYEDNFNFLSKMCLGKMRTAAFEMFAMAKASGALVIASGSDASDCPLAYLRAGADFVVRGEGLDSLQALLGHIENSVGAFDPSTLAAHLHGVAVLDSDELKLSSGARPMPIAREANTPAWDLIDVERYRAVWQDAHGFFSLNMAASRGCSFRCNWCAKPIWGNQYLQRPPQEVAAEMAYLKHTLGAHHIWFADDIWGFRPDWVQAFSESARSAAGLLPFTIQTRADLITPRMAQALAGAGCREAWIGAESGSQKILDAMNKGTTVEQILTARARLAEWGVRVGFFIQIGYLGEELEDLLATRRLIEETRPDEVGVSVSYPLPGTPFYEQVKHQLSEKTRWRESDDLAMMFHGTYRSDFYRIVRDLLHAQVDLDNSRRRSPALSFHSDQRALHARWDTLIAEERRHRVSEPEIRANLFA